MLVRGDAGVGAGAGPQGETGGGKVGEVVSGRARMEWLVAIKRRKLMDNPHYETGSQDEVVILASESRVPLEEVIAMRFILRQPSPDWRSFSLEEISVYRESVVTTSSVGQEGSSLPSKLEILRRHTTESLKVIYDSLTFYVGVQSPGVESTGEPLLCVAGPASGGGRECSSLPCQV